MVCVVKGSPGTQCSGVSSQAKDTFRALSGTRSGVLDMASMY
ncbi:hypothetical protein QF037_006705 [Streptomyces canus]|nr:hypothetical protein [Streptomyces canus]